MPDEAPRPMPPSSPPAQPAPARPGDAKGVAERLVRAQMDRLGGAAAGFAKEKLAPTGHAVTGEMRKIGWQKAALWAFGIALGLGFLSMAFGG